MHVYSTLPRPHEHVDAADGTNPRYILEVHYLPEEFPFAPYIVGQVDCTDENVRPDHLTGGWNYTPVWSCSSLEYAIKKAHRS